MREDAQSLISAKKLEKEMKEKEIEQGGIMQEKKKKIVV